MDSKLFKIIFFKYFFYFNTFITCLLSLYPGNLIGLIFFGDDSTFPGSDKMHHFFSYFILSIVGSIAYFEKKFFYRLFIFLVSLGFFLELLQIWIPNRYFEFLDMFSNFFGVLVGLNIVRFFKKYYDKI